MPTIRTLCIFQSGVFGRGSRDPRLHHSYALPMTPQQNPTSKSIAERLAANSLIKNLTAIWSYRHFWLSLVQVDLRRRYRGSVMGVGWSLLHPIAMTTVLCIVFHKLFNMDVVEYAPFLFSGLIVWNFLTMVIAEGCYCFHLGESYIRQCPTPLAIFPLRTALGAGFHFVISLCVVIALQGYLKGFDDVAALVILVPACALLFLLGWSLAILCGLSNVLFPDVQHLVQIGLQIAFYATPILYPASMLRERSLGWLVDYNPVGSLLELFRNPILHGQFPALPHAAIAIAWVLVMLTFSIGLMARYQRRLIFYL